MPRLDPSVKECLSLFLPTWLPESGDEKKDRKAHKIGHEAYEKARLYDFQMRAQSLVKSIEMSQLLGGNDVILPIIVQEYIDLYKAMDEVKKALQKVKSVLPIALIDSKLKLKDCSDALYFDLQQFDAEWGSQYPVNIPLMMSAYKASIFKYNNPNKPAFVDVVDHIGSIV